MTEYEGGQVRLVCRDCSAQVGPPRAVVLVDLLPVPTYALADDSQTDTK